MATIVEKRNKKGELTRYKVMACVGRDENYRQVWKTTTFKRPAGFTPARERKEIERLAAAWEKEQKSLFEQGCTGSSERITFEKFVEDHWWADHVNDGTHTPSSVSFYRYMANDD